MVELGRPRGVNYVKADATSVRMTGSFNSRVCMDFVHLKEANAATRIFLHVLVFYR